MLKFLKTDNDFAAFKVSRSFGSKLLKIRVHYSLNQNTSRFGFIIPKKVVPKVVDRNLLKRRIKSVLGKIVNQIKTADIIFYPQKELVKENYTALASEVKQLFGKARLWK